MKLIMPSAASATPVDLESITREARELCAKLGVPMPEEARF